MMMMMMMMSNAYLCGVMWCGRDSKLCYTLLKGNTAALNQYLCPWGYIDNRCLVLDFRFDKKYILSFLFLRFSFSLLFRSSNIIHSILYAPFFIFYARRTSSFLRRSLWSGL